MKTIVSKQIVTAADRGIGGLTLLDKDYFNQIKEQLGKEPRYSLKEDDGDRPRKKTTVETPQFSTRFRPGPFGSDIQSLDDDNEKDTANIGLSSGYSDGGRGREDSPVGNDTRKDDENTNPYRGTTAFLSEDDHTEDHNLWYDSDPDKRNVEKRNLNRVRELSPVNPPKKYSVDRF